jgi:hypothetical protein
VGAADWYRHRLYPLRAADVSADFRHRAGRQKRLSTARALLLAFIYVQGWP